MSTDVVQDELNIFTDDILDMIGKSEIDITSEFNIVGKYYEDNFFKETEFTVTKDSLKLENMIVNMEFKRNDDENDFSQFINKCTIEFMNKWNKEIVGKYDWDKINCMEDMNSILE